MSYLEKRSVWAPENTATSKAGGLMMKTGGLGGLAVFGVGLLPFIPVLWSVMVVMAVVFGVGLLIY